MTEEKIELKMHELEKLIRYTFKDVSFLSLAMNSTKIRSKPKEYKNQALATVGDAVLKTLLADYLYKRDKSATKESITNDKELLEKNDTLHVVAKKTEIIRYAYNDDAFYNDAPNYKQVIHGKHDPYIEAIVGAIYYDAGFDKTKAWFEIFLLPLLEKYKTVETKKDC